MPRTHKFLGLIPRIKSNKIKIWGLRDGTVQWLRALVRAEDSGSNPSTLWWLTAVHNSSSRAPNTVFWLPRYSMHVVHSHICAQNTHTQNNEIAFKNKIRLKFKIRNKNRRISSTL